MTKMRRKNQGDDTLPPLGLQQETFQNLEPQQQLSLQTKHQQEDLQPLEPHLIRLAQKRPPQRGHQEEDMQLTEAHQVEVQQAETYQAEVQQAETHQAKTQCLGLRQRYLPLLREL